MNLNLPQILNVAIGLALIYLTLSIFASEIQEILTAWLQFRAKHLKKSIYRLFGGTQNSKKLEQKLKGLKEENNYYPPQQLANLDGETKIIFLVNKLYQHPAILSTTQTTLGISPKDDISSNLYGPSYITAEDFSEALIDILSKAFQWLPEVKLNTIMEDLKPRDPKAIIPPMSEHYPNEQSLKEAKNCFCDRSLKRLYEVAEVADKWCRKKMPDKSDLELFKTAMKDWYNKAQYHTSGTYKRNSKYVLFIIGLLTAVLINANTFQIARNLLINPENNINIETISNEIIKGCDTNLVANQQVDEDQCKKEIQRVNQIIDNIQSSNLPMGWSTDALAFNHLVGFFVEFHKNPFNLILPLIYQLLGWTVSALAIMMGATFWFDILKKFVNIRNTVAPPSSPSQSELDTENVTK